MAQTARTVSLAVAATLGGAVITVPAQAAVPAPTPEREQPRASSTRTPDAAPQVLASPVTAAARLGARAGTTYTVKAGDTVSHISVRTGIKIVDIVAANGLGSRAFIRAGQVLVLPTGKPAAAPAPASTPATSGYTVKSGDTVSHIAARAGVSVSSVLRANGLSMTSIIRPGQVLDVPGARATAAAPAARPAAGTATTAYRVKSGDTLSHIAVRQGTSVAALRAANPSLDSRGTIRVGQSIAVPAKAAPMPNTFAGRTYPDATVSAATANRDALLARSVPTRDQMRSIIAASAREQGIDASMALAVAFQESGFNMRAVSPANAVGAMQVIPSSGRWAAELTGRPVDLLDPHDNARAGTAILAALVRTSATQAEALAGYYQGQTSVRRNGMYPDTRRYVANVQTLMARFR